MANPTQSSAAKPSHDIVDLSIAIFASLGLTIAALFVCTVPFAGHIAGSRDFVAYWATGHQLVQRANPYDHEAIAALEHAVGLGSRTVLMMRNPPWALPLAYPLGFLGVRLGAVLWSLMLVACLVISVLLVYRLHGSLPGPIPWLGMAFTPALVCLLIGQTSLLSLLGLTLFLRYHAERPFAAGAALWFCLLKPHLFLPLAVVLCMWIVTVRAWRIVAGSIAAVALSSAIAWLIDPLAWSDYLALMRSPAVANDFIPCLAYALRLWLRPPAVWLQYLPAVLGCVWAVIYFWRHRSTWNWNVHGSLLMLVSLLVAPYSWLYDQCLAIPALLSGAYLTRRRSLILILATLILAADLEFGFIKVVSLLWLWTAPAWLVWFLLARAYRLKTALPDSSQESAPHLAVEPIALTSGSQE